MGGGGDRSEVDQTSCADSDKEARRWRLVSGRSMLQLITSGWRKQRHKTTAAAATATKAHQRSPAS